MEVNHPQKSTVEYVYTASVPEYKTLLVLIALYKAPGHILSNGERYIKTMTNTKTEASNGHEDWGSY